ncbi:hypothetical protein C8N40_10127 [Pontibacter mucosus]|uniref:Uncharacterized protein n=1 Tax=Pontibacter mucosus TaxID=1649266 RepID=A0A2T5YSB6_9BACT|nr:hypothetical protein [Pontibacter mucosus]PTX22205.1 hypothetical protein C8N40_10127 [Pontibacter mucosus]
MQLKLLFSRWAQVAGLFLMGGTLAWAIKLAVIVSTNGRIITSGAAAFFMATGIVLLIIGSTGIGYYLSRNRSVLVRVIAMLLSPALVFGSFILIGMVTNPLLQNSSIWYAQQEAPIGVAVILYMAVGYFLFRNGKSHTTYA